MFAKNWWEVVVMEKQDLRKFKRKDLCRFTYKNRNMPNRLNEDY